MVKDKEYFKDSYGNVYGDLMVTPTGRAAWVYLAEPSTQGNPPKYSLTILFDKDDEKVVNGLSPFLDAFDALLAEKFPDGKMPAQEIPALRDGDDDKTKSYKGFSNTFWLKASSKKPVDVFNAKKERIEASAIEPGMLVKLVVTPMAAQKGAAYQLKGVQLVKDDGVRYYGGPDPRSLFDVLEDKEDSPSSSSEEALEPEVPQRKSVLPGKKVIAKKEEESVAPTLPVTQGKSAAQIRLEETMAKRKAASSLGVKKTSMAEAMNKL